MIEETDDIKTTSDYQRIAKAIEYISDHKGEQPSLDEIAAHLNLSPFHFQRLFSRWAGITPKRFLQSLTVEHAKELLEKSESILSVSEEVGLSSSARLHDHFVSIEAVTPGEFKSKGAGLEIVYGVHESHFGDVFVASTERGICYLIFVDTRDHIDEAFGSLKSMYPNAKISEQSDQIAPVVNKLFAEKHPKQKHRLLLSGTNFQINVWKALLRIPYGQLSTYGQIATAIGKPKACRAVGTAVGANPISFLIPCHRVIQSTGVIGNYRWGPTRKKALLAWESVD